jgi:NAD(P)-dependent dehydrogenase (short-subunit alcohol dehydrogenase family)
MKRLNGKVAVVTGAGQGIGRGIAHALAKDGASVVLAGRTGKKVQVVADEMTELGLSGIAVQCDVANPEQVALTVEQAIEAFGRLDVLVNNAAGGHRGLGIPFEETPLSQLREVIDTNVVGTFLFMQACFPHLKESGGGRVINLGSGYGTEGTALWASYAATKEAVRALTRVAAKEWGVHSITVNAIAPLADSPPCREHRALYPEQMAMLEQTIPLGRIGDCEEDIGPVAVFLASDDSRYMTGQTLMVDGGLFVLR